MNKCFSNIQQDQVYSLLQFMPMVRDLGEGLKYTCGLSNVSNGAPDHLRPILNRTYLVMLEKSGMYSAIADPYDKDLVDIARGRRPDVVEIIGKVMDEEAIDMSSLSKELQDYLKQHISSLKNHFIPIPGWNCRTLYIEN